MNFDIGAQMKAFVNVGDIMDFLSWEAVIYLIAAFILLWIGKLINDIVTPYKIDEELTGKDNKALAVSFIGYIIAVVIIIVGVLSETTALGAATGLTFAQRIRIVGFELIDIAIWSVVGILLLIVSRFLNDKLILSKFDNVKEIIEDRNVGTGAVQFGTYIGTAFIIKAVIFGESSHWLSDVIGTALFFILAQLAFVVFGAVYQKITSYDIHAEIEKDNVAAGVGFGLHLAAMGIILSSAIEKSDSLIILVLWFVEGVVLLLITRVLVDKIILPGHKLNDEIAKDQNWGAALISGGVAILIAFLLNASFA